MTLIFASHNQNKTKEISALLPREIDLKCLVDLHHFSEIPETGLTLNENAEIKSRAIFDQYKEWCFADDSGLEIEALDNQPGVYSARFAGEEKNDVANMNKVLQLLDNESNRSARFRTVISLIKDNETLFFEGEIKGTITKTKKGNNGFGYDPIFIPEGYSKTFAEMTKEEKNMISHRSIAVKKLVKYLTGSL